MLHWFTSRQPRTHRPHRGAQRRSAPLNLEALEERAVPAVFNVNTLADVLGGANLSLRQAILNSNQTPGPNTINLTVGGTYQLTRFGNAHDGTNGALQIANQNLTINGLGAANTVIDGGGVDRVFDVEGTLNVAFNGITIQHGLASSNSNKGPEKADNAADGGGIFSPLANLTLTNTVVADNLATFQGGGIWTDVGNVAINGGAVRNNAAPATGGGLFTNFGDISVTNASFANNISDGTGGGLVINSPPLALASIKTAIIGNLSIAGSTFTGNTAENVGGAIVDLSTGNKVSITGSTITDNTADSDGGGLFIKAASLTIDRSTISDNTANGMGGGIFDNFNANQVLSITNSALDGNTAFLSGGGVISNAATATFANDRFTNNVAQIGGGFAFLGANLTLSSSHVDGNRAQTANGGMEMVTQMKGSTCTITNSTLNNNRAAGATGGGLIICTTLTVSSSSIDGNRCGDTIAGLDASVTTATFTNVNVIGNFASGNIGGLDLSETTLTMTGCNISNNQASGSVGGLVADGTATISNTTINGNRAGVTVGGLAFNGTRLNLQTDTITNNFAAFGDGGASVFATNGGTISDTTISGNWTAGNAGGLETKITGGTLTITGSSISNNHSGLDGGGIFINGAGTVSLSNDTVFGNTAAVTGGGISHESVGTLNLANVTIDGNAAANGGGIFSATATVNVHNSIIASNFANPTSGPDVNGVLFSQGFNLIGVIDAANNSFSNNGMKNDQVGSVAAPLIPRLGPLQNNGGPTFSQALLRGSPAITKGDGAGAPATDQRGFNRPATPSIGTFDPKVAANASANQIYVENLFEALLNRTADAGAAGLVNELNNGVAPATVVLQIEGSPEYRASQVKALFQRYLHRNADGPGLQGFVNLLGNGGTLEQAASILLGSQEYFDLHGGTNDSFLYALFEDTLGRAPDHGALVGFGQALAGGMARGQAASLVLSSNEYRNLLVQTDFQSVMGKLPDAQGLAFFVGELQHGVSDQVVLAQILGSAEAFAARI